MKTAIAKDQWEPRSQAIIFADEDVDGVCSAAIVGRRYHVDNKKYAIRFVNARNLGEVLQKEITNQTSNEIHEYENMDVFIVDVGINKANIKQIENSISYLDEKGVRVLYFDSHSNKYKGKNLLTYLKKANANVYNGKIGLAAASIVQDFLGNEETNRLRLLGALSDREIQLTNRYKSEKAGLRALQAAVAWGAYKDRQFLDKITKRLIRHPNMDLKADKEILEYSIKANNHRDNLLRHIHKNANILQLSESPRILCVNVMDRIDFGKARGTIAGRLAGEWGAAIILVTQAVSDNRFYAVTIRNSYIHKLDLESLGQLAGTQNSGGSKGAYRLTIPKDELLGFLTKVQAWARTITPPWLVRKHRSNNNRNFKRKTRRKSNKPKKYDHNPRRRKIIDTEDGDEKPNNGSTTAQPIVQDDEFELIEVLDIDDKSDDV